MPKFVSQCETLAITGRIATHNNDWNTVNLSRHPIKIARNCIRLKNLDATFFQHIGKHRDWINTKIPCVAKLGRNVFDFVKCGDCGVEVVR